MSTHNVCIRREIRKILCGYPLLYVAMNNNNKKTTKKHKIQHQENLNIKHHSFV